MFLRVFARNKATLERLLNSALLTGEAQNATLIQSKAEQMKTKLVVKFLLPVLLFVGPYSLIAADAPKGSRPNIYDETLAGQKQIDDAMAQAKKGDKRILIQFGANWCGWCHRLHKLFETDKPVSDELKADYVLILVDVNNGHNKDLMTKYAADRLGLPSLVVLDSQGKHVTTKNTAELEEGDHHSPEKVLAFLKQWAPAKQRS